jgi:hypothetical protein
MLLYCEFFHHFFTAIEKNRNERERERQRQAAKEDFAVSLSLCFFYVFVCVILMAAATTVAMFVVVTILMAVLSHTDKYKEIFSFWENLLIDLELLSHIRRFKQTQLFLFLYKHNDDKLAIKNRSL